MVKYNILKLKKLPMFFSRYGCRPEIQQPWMPGFPGMTNEGLNWPLKPLPQRGRRGGGESKVISILYPLFLGEEGARG
jgi:hypothetical protein